MSIPKPRRYTYYERIKATFQEIHDPMEKSLCDCILKFIENCFGDSRPKILDFTDKKSEEKICQFLLKDREFFNQIFGNFCDLFLKDLIPKSGLLYSISLLKNIEKLGYEVICLSALYSPLELQKTFVSTLSNFLAKNQPESAFGRCDLTAWTALLLMINPVKLKQQCDGSIEVFGHFKNILGYRVALHDSNIRLSNSCLKATIQLALGVSIKYSRNSLGLAIPHEFNDIEIINDAIAKMALEFLHAYIVQVPSFNEFSFSVDVIDSVIKNFICYFPEKIVEIYNLCEEELYNIAESRDTMFINGEQNRIMPQQNFDNLHFKTLLELIAALYEPENAQLTQLSIEFTDPNCEALCDFISKGRAISAPILKISYLSMLKSLCKGPQSAEVFFNIFK